MNPSDKEGSGLPSGAIQPEQTSPTSAAGQPAAASGFTIPLPSPAPAIPQPPAAGAVAQTSSLQADDGDLIEKEWVTKAKQIVERTKDNPYKQSEDLTLFKADYMKKRYGKTIKVNR